MLRYFITDRRTAPLLRSIQQAIDRGVERIQIREKDLSARELMALMTGINRKNSQIFVNGRMDVALATGADGLHLPSDSPSVSRLRELAPSGFLIATSCHSIVDVRRAEKEGADFAVLGPIFATPSKRMHGPPLGLRILHQAVHASALPLFALGGVCETNLAACRRAGAAGVAGIRLFQGA